MPRATDNEEARELAVDGSDLFLIITELLGHGIYVGLAARANGNCSITARKDSRMGKWDFSPSEDPQEVIEQLLADVIKPKKR